MMICLKKCMGSVAIAIMAMTVTADAVSQTPSHREELPNAPASQLLAQTGVQLSGANSVSATTTPRQNQTPSSSSSPANRTKLTRSQAEQMAIKNNPQVSVARLLALAQHQVYRETRSSELPIANAAITGVEAEDASRISAGSLTASRLFTHAGAGGGFSQLLTDFGKTRNLVASAVLQDKAQKANALATQFDVELATDQAFYNALQAQETLKVAQQNVTTRQTLQSQVNQMTINKLKSTLDLSFADVSLSQAKLLSLDAQNNADSTMAALDAVLGIDHQEEFELVDDGPDTRQPPPDIDQLVQASLKQRPDLQATQFSQQAAEKFSHAQRDQMFPTIAASGTVGSVPIRPSQYYTTNWWGGIGVNINIPVFNGFLYSAQAKEASLRAQAASEQTRDLRDRIVRDVRTAWLTANTSYQRVSVTAELLKEADLGLKLAQTRYQMGLSSIVELSQAEYQQTDAAIGNANAQYQYRLALATLNYQVGSVP
ncbi:TolC family protein [Telmatobacter sp. DSM 110680]|uniref:TolC family protein n=1 Tax=Telmatobacter sp. DSM 110680 TaxID=3036704 RepID=A0AAU7DDI8_9BACT